METTIKKTHNIRMTVAFELMRQPIPMIELTQPIASGAIAAAPKQNGIMRRFDELLF